MLAAGLSTSGPVPRGHQPRKVRSLIGNGCSLMDGVTATGEGAEALPGCLRGAGPLGNGSEAVCVTVCLRRWNQHHQAFIFYSIFWPH